MDGLTIGDKVLVIATAHTRYVYGHKIWYVESIDPKEAWYVGYTWKQEGYHKIADYNPAIEKHNANYLTNIKSIKLMRVKFHEFGNDYYAFRQHVKKMEGE